MSEPEDYETIAQHTPRSRAGSTSLMDTMRRMRSASAGRLREATTARSQLPLERARRCGGGPPLTDTANSERIKQCRGEPPGVDLVTHSAGERAGRPNQTDNYGTPITITPRHSERYTSEARRKTTPK